MALNNIQLNPALLKEMYKASLVEVKESGDKKTLSKMAASAFEKTGSLKEWPMLGRLKKNILIVLYTHGTRDSRAFHGKSCIPFRELSHFNCQSLIERLSHIYRFEYVYCVRIVSLLLREGIRGRYCRRHDNFLLGIQIC